MNEAKLIPKRQSKSRLKETPSFQDGVNVLQCGLTELFVDSNAIVSSNSR